jgi:hypothetical protein
LVRAHACAGDQAGYDIRLRQGPPKAFGHVALHEPRICPGGVEDGGVVAAPPVLHGVFAGRVLPFQPRIEFLLVAGTAGRGTGCVTFCRVGEDREFVHDREGCAHVPHMFYHGPLVKSIFQWVGRGLSCRCLASIIFDALALVRRSSNDSRHRQFKRSTLNSSNCPREVQTALAARARLLESIGPMLGRPHVDTLKNSRHGNMKELRFDAADGAWRAAFAFDPARQAVVLVAGDKSGGSEARFYRSLIATADKRFHDPLVRQKKGD